MKQKTAISSRAQNEPKRESIAPAAFRRPQHAIGKERQGQREADRAWPVEPSCLGVAGFRQEYRPEDEGDDSEADHERENRPPPVGLDHHARRHRPKRQADTETCSDQAEGAHAFLSVELLCQRCHPAGKGRGRAEALKRAKAVEPDDVRRKGKPAGKQDEGGKAAQEDALAAIAVCQRAGRHQCAAKCQHEGVGDPVVSDWAAAEFGTDRWQGHGGTCKGERHGRRCRADGDQDEDFLRDTCRFGFMGNGHRISAGSNVGRA
ncbi:hypothetical protein FHT92_004350 [Rhizobium sp. BK377]|nr:hypothetical protein [Rhizobium sp. BK377]